MNKKNATSTFLAIMLAGFSVLGCGSNDVKIAGAPDVNELAGPDIDLPSPTAKSVITPTDATSADNDAAVKQVSIKVNTMTCVEGCFNGIQSVLKKRDGITDVVLAPQDNKEGLVDNSVILVSYKGDLDKDEMKRTILGAGFDSIEFLEAN